MLQNGHWEFGKRPSDTLKVNELPSHFTASGGSLVPDTLMEVRDAALLKKCLKDGGTSLPFLQKQKENKNEIMTLHRVNMGYNVTNFTSLFPRFFVVPSKGSVMQKTFMTTLRFYYSSHALKSHDPLYLLFQIRSCSSTNQAAQMGPTYTVTLSWKGLVAHLFLTLP